MAPDVSGEAARRGGVVGCRALLRSITASWPSVRRIKLSNKSRYRDRGLRRSSVQFNLSLTERRLCLELQRERFFTASRIANEAEHETQNDGEGERLTFSVNRQTSASPNEDA